MLFVPAWRSSIPDLSCGFDVGCPRFRLVRTDLEPMVWVRPGRWLAPLAVPPGLLDMGECWPAGSACRRGIAGQGVVNTAAIHKGAWRPFSKFGQVYRKKRSVFSDDVRTTIAAFSWSRFLAISGQKNGDLVTTLGAAKTGSWSPILALFVTLPTGATHWRGMSSEWPNERRASTRAATWYMLSPGRSLNLTRAVTELKAGLIWCTGTPWR